MTPSEVEGGGGAIPSPSLGTFEERRLLGTSLREMLAYHGIEVAAIVNDTVTRMVFVLKGPNPQRLLDLLRRAEPPEIETEELDDG